MSGPSAIYVKAFMGYNLNLKKQINNEKKMKVDLIVILYNKII